MNHDLLSHETVRERIANLPLWDGGIELHTIAAAIGLPIHSKQSLARVSNALRALGHPVERHRVQVGDVIKITRLAFSPAHKVA